MEIRIPPFCANLFVKEFILRTTEPSLEVAPTTFASDICDKRLAGHTPDRFLYLQWTANTDCVTKGRLRGGAWVVGVA